MAEGVHARLRVGGEALERGEHDAGGPEHDRHGPGAIDADAERAGRLVAGAGRDGHAVGGRAADLRALEHARQPRGLERERVEHLLAPAPLGDVQQQRAGGVGDVGRVLAAQAQPDVVLRQRDARDAREHVRLVAAQPEQFRRRESRQRAVAGQRDQPLRARASPRSRGTPRRCAGRSRGSPAAARGPRSRAPPARASDPESPMPCGRPGCGAQPREHRLGRPPPVLGILLGPAGAGRRQRIAGLRGCERRRPRRRARGP